jgi:hypothetical protein
MLNTSVVRLSVGRQQYTGAAVHYYIGQQCNRTSVQQENRTYLQQQGNSSMAGQRCGLTAMHQGRAAEMQRLQVHMYTGFNANRVPHAAYCQKNPAHL